MQLTNAAWYTTIRLWNGFHKNNIYLHNIWTKIYEIMVKIDGNGFIYKAGGIG